MEANKFRGPRGQDHLKFPNGDKVTDNIVENFCKQFVE